jgi:hypothetical protein
MADLRCDKCSHSASIIGLLWLSVFGRWQCPKCLLRRCGFTVESASKR